MRRERQTTATLQGHPDLTFCIMSYVSCVLVKDLVCVHVNIIKVVFCVNVTISCPQTLGWTRAVGLQLLMSSFSLRKEIK